MFGLTVKTAGDQLTAIGLRRCHARDGHEVAVRLLDGVHEAAGVDVPHLERGVGRHARHLVVRLTDGHYGLVVRVRHLGRLVVRVHDRPAVEHARAREEAFALLVEDDGEDALLAGPILRVGEGLQALERRQVPDAKDALGRQADQLLVALVARDVHYGEQVAVQLADDFVEHERIVHAYELVLAAGGDQIRLRAVAERVQAFVDRRLTTDSEQETNKYLSKINDLN